MNIFMKQKLTDIENKSVATKGEKLWGGTNHKIYNQGPTGQHGELDLIFCDNLYEKMKCTNEMCM